MSEIKKVWIPAFRYVFPADFENWMETMEAEGWHVDHVGQWDSLLMTFKRGEPKKYRFVYDIQPIVRKDYKDTYKQFGWEFVGQMASVYLWRMEYTDKRPDAFSDAESIAARNKRNVLAASVSFFIFLICSLAAAVFLVFFPGVLSHGDRVQIFWAMMLGWVMTALVGWAVFYMIKRSRR